MPVPHFVIKNKFQRRSDLYSDILNSDILRDVCQRVTGRSDYTCEFDDRGYNIGRLATIEYEGTITYVSFSESEISSRNSSFQSFPSALVRYHQEENTNKRICFYFLPPTGTGNFETNYFIFMYRLMKTAGTEFLNEADYLDTEIVPFTTVEDIIVHRNFIRGRNRSNRSTYLTRSADNTLQIYGKTYGANKYETTLLCIAISEITTSQIELYEICEQNLRILPARALEVINALGKIIVIPTDLTMEREEFEENDSLRSSAYIFNLWLKLGDKKCALCECEIPQLVQGAHIWPVADIKQAGHLNQEQKLQSAIDGENGIWLCQNHHKLLDLHLLIISENGQLKYKSGIPLKTKNYILDVTINDQLSGEIITPEFLHYREKRNSLLEESRYRFIGQ